MLVYLKAATAEDIVSRSPGGNDLQCKNIIGSSHIYYVLFFFYSREYASIRCVPVSFICIPTI